MGFFWYNLEFLKEKSSTEEKEPLKSLENAVSDSTYMYIFNEDYSDSSPSTTFKHVSRDSTGIYQKGKNDIP